MKLADLNPCADGLASARESRTLRDAWDVARRQDLMWLIVKAHTSGTLSRREIVLVVVRCVECVAHLLADDSLPHLATVSSWAHGADDVTAEDLRKARLVLDDAAYAVDAATRAASYASYAAYAADAADAASYASYAAYAVDAATRAASYASYAADAADAADAASYAADVIRDAITLETVCSALSLNPDEVL